MCRNASVRLELRVFGAGQRPTQKVSGVGCQGPPGNASAIKNLGFLADPLGC